MAYKVIAKQHERREQRSLDINGIVYPPKMFTVGLDRELRELREKVAEHYGDAAKHFLFAAGLDEERMPLQDQPDEKARKTASEKGRKADEAGIRARCDLIVAALGPAETGEVLTTDNLLELLEVADIDAYQGVLFGETPTLPDRPTGDSDAD